MSKKFFLALATFVGTIVGVGLFGLPYITVKTSFLTILGYFLIIGIFTFIIQLAYGEIVLETKGKHQFSGYANIYLGKKWKTLAFLVEFLFITCALTAYLIVGGDFLWQILGPILGGHLHLYVLIYFVLGASLLYLGIKSVAESELILLFILIAAVIIFFFINLKGIHFSYLQTTSLQNLFLPYGPMIFSLWGITVIPEVSEILGRQHKYLKWVLFIGVLISITVYTLFIITVVGLSGNQTSIDALPGLGKYLSSEIMTIAFLLGILTTFTSFLALAEAAKRSFIEDWKLSKNNAWILSCFIPPLLYLMGFKNFLNIISLAGAVLLGFFGIILFLTYLKAKGHAQRKADYRLKLPDWLVYIFIALLLIGVIAEIAYSTHLIAA